MTVRFKNELVRNITIKLGYANAKVCLCSVARRRPFRVWRKGCMFLTHTRYTNAKMRLVRDRETTAHIAPTKKITHHANDQAADTV